MIYIFVMPVLLLYYFLFIHYFQGLFPPNGRKIPQVLLTLALVVASYAGVNAFGMPLLNFPAISVVVIVGLRFSTGMNWSQSACSGSACSITAYCVRGIFTSLASFIFHGSKLLYNTTAYYLITMFAVPSSLVFFVLLRKTILPDEKIRQFFNNRSHLTLVIGYETASTINLVVIHWGRYYQTPNSGWYMGIALGACTLTLFMLIYAIYHSIRSTDLLEYQWRAKVLEDQYQRQLQHYKSYQKHTESFRAFRHDYKSMMVTLKNLIQSSDNENAVQLLDDIYEEMQTKVQIYKHQSDNVVLDAVLQDLENMCEEEEIRLSCHVFSPRDTKLALLDAIRVFSNITNNAVEACKKVPAPERFIQITSSNDLQWATVEVINSFDGKVVFHKGRLGTTKREKCDHGMGLNIVREIAENIGGFLVCDADVANKTFLTRVHIPRFSDESHPSLFT